MTDLTPPHSIQPPWPLAALLVLAASLFMALTTEMLPAGLLTTMAIDLDVSETAAGWLVSAFAFMMALGAIPLTAATRRIPRRRLLVSVLIGFALVNTATALSGTFTATMIARLTGGLVAGVFWSITVAYATSLVPSNMAGRALAVVFAGQSVAFVGGVPLGTALGATFGWRTSFGVLAAIAIALMIAVVRWLPKIVDSVATDSAPLRSVLANRGVVAVSLTTLLIMLGHFSLYTFVSPLLARSGINGSTIGLALLIYGVAGASGVWVSGKTVDRRPRTAVLCTLIILLVVMLTLAILGSNAVASIVSMALWGFTFGSLPILLHAAVVRASPSSPDLADAVLNSAFNIGVGMGAVLGGQIISHSSTTTLPWISWIFVLASLTLTFVSRRSGFTPIERPHNSQSARARKTLIS